jgi:hypothetical membrane protein
MTTSTKANVTEPSTLKILLACGIIGPLFFIIVFLIEGATRADYNPLRHPVSSLSIGELGWMQAANFLISGLLILAFSFGLRRVLPSTGRSWVAILIALVGIGLIGAGFFTTDPLNGYPPGTELVPTVRTVAGRLHDLFSLPVFVALPIACFIFSRRFARNAERGWAIYSVLTGIAMFVTFMLAGVGFRQVVPALADSAGLLQRTSIIIGFAWIALLALRLMRSSPPSL